MTERRGRDGAESERPETSSGQPLRNWRDGLRSDATGRPRETGRGGVKSNQVKALYREAINPVKGLKKVCQTSRQPSDVQPVSGPLRQPVGGARPRRRAHRGGRQLWEAGRPHGQMMTTLATRRRPLQRSAAAATDGQRLMDFRRPRPLTDHLKWRRII